MERRDNWPLTERHREFLEIQSGGLGQVGQCLFLGLTLGGGACLWVQGTEPTFGRGPQDRCPFDGVTGLAFISAVLESSKSDRKWTKMKS